MKFILTFIAGLLIGAGGLFAYLRQLPAGTPAMAIAGISAAMAPGAPQVANVVVAEAALPTAPVVTANLNEANLATPPAATIPATLPVVAVAAPVVTTAKGPR